MKEKSWKKFDPNDFHCHVCGKLKNPEDFFYFRGKRTGICKECYNEKQKVYYNKKKQEGPQPRRKYEPNDFYCPRCDEFKKPEEFYWHIDGRKSNICKACDYERMVELRHRKNPDIKHMGSLPHKVEKDFDYAAAKNLIGKYKICPVCGRAKPLADFSKETLIRLPVLFHYNHPDYALVIREFFEECSDCRNRMKELHDHFIMEAY